MLASLPMCPKSNLHRPRASALLAVLLLATCVASAFGGQAAQDDDKDKDKVLPPEQVTLRTTDGVTLLATFYPSKLAKSAVPVILLHASKGTRGDFEQLALLLQRAGHAVIAPDLRGHGESAHADSVDRAAELRPADYEAMVTEDVEAVKRYLMVKNNASELNIEKLCLVGVEMGAVVAINWAAQDWSWPVLATGKQGEDVKALVLISPEWGFKGLRINDAVAHPNVRADLSVMLIAGKTGSKAMHEVKRLYSALEKYHPQPTEETATNTLWLRTPQTSLQGTRLLNEKSMHVDQIIAKFIELRVAKLTLPWHERKNPFE